MQRAGIHTISFTDRCESGLYIGGTQDELTIGGSYNPVIKNPANGKPHIPGASPKGKMRNELEKQLGRFGGDRNDRPCSCAKLDCPVCGVFGAPMNTSSQLGPSCIIVRDGPLCCGGRIENKNENVVNRMRAGAEHPRSNVRVVEGSEFSMRIVLQVFDNDAGFSYNGHQDSAAPHAVVAE